MLLYGEKHGWLMCGVAIFLLAPELQQYLCQKNNSRKFNDLCSLPAGGPGPAPCHEKKSDTVSLSMQELIACRAGHTQNGLFKTRAMASPVSR